MFERHMRHLGSFLCWLCGTSCVWSEDGLAKNARANTFPKNDGDGQGPTDDVTSGMQGACDGLLTHIFHCDAIGSAPVCISVSDFPASVAPPSSLLLMGHTSRAARSHRCNALRTPPCTFSLRTSASPTPFLSQQYTSPLTQILCPGRRRQ